MMNLHGTLGLKKIKKTNHNLRGLENKMNMKIQKLN